MAEHSIAGLQFQAEGPDQTRRTRLLHTVLLALAGPSIVFGLLTAVLWMLGKSPVVWMLPGLGPLLLYMVAYGLSRRGRDRLATYVPIVMLFMMIVGLSLTLGAGKTTVIGYAVVVLTAGILVDTRAALVFVLLSVGANWIVGSTQTADGLTDALSPEIVRIVDGIGLGLGLVVLVIFHSLSDRDLRLRLYGEREFGAVLRAQKAELEQRFEERKRAERELKSSEERLKILFEYAPDGYYLSDLKGTFIDGNRAAQEIVGFKKEDLIGKSFLQMKLLSLRQVPKAAALLAKNALGQATGPDEFVLTRQDGSQVTVDISTYPVKIDGQAQVLGMARDITERKRSEDKLRRAHDELELRVQERTAELEIANTELSIEVVERARVERSLAFRNTVLSTQQETSLDGILVVDENGRMVSFNQRFVEMWAIPADVLESESDERALQSVLDKLVDPEEFISRVDYLYANRNQKSHEKVLLADGRTFERYSAPMLGPDGAYYGRVWYFGDITERLRVEQQIETSLKEKEVLLQEIHHRVKNNLQVISSLLSLQARTIEEPLTLEILTESQNRVRSMALIHEKLYRSESLSRIDFGDYIDGLTNHLFRTYNARVDSVQLEIDVENVFLGVDTATPCGLLLNELVSNALKHAFPNGKGGKIHVGLYSDRGAVTLVVRDDGVGFPVDVDVRHAESLGLQLVNTLVEQLDGTIELQRAKPSAREGGHGAAFQVTFAAPDYREKG